MSNLIENSFLNKVKQLSHEEPQMCFLCKKCSNGCPLNFAMDILPHKIMRMIHLGMEDKVLASSTIWLCVACETCATRCPNDIEIARVMDFLRQISLKSNKTDSKNPIPAFHNSFLHAIKLTGRLYELGMIGEYKLRSGDLLGDMKLGLDMFTKGKLNLIPHIIKGMPEIREIFKKSREHIER